MFFAAVNAMIFIIPDNNQKEGFTMRPAVLQKGDTIGIVSPSHIAVPDHYRGILFGIEAMGFQVKTGTNLYKDTFGYQASEEERAEDFNAMVSDEKVKMVFFGGGEGSIDLLPLIDYTAVKNNPKIYMSYSDGTSILNAIYHQTGLSTYYGQSPDMFSDLRHYDYRQFESHLLQGNVTDYKPNSPWVSICPGTCEGLLIGGYTLNYALLVNSRYGGFDPSKEYILFLEDHEKFSDIPKVSMYLSHIGQSDLMANVKGLLFGHYSEKIHPELLERLSRFGNQHNIPVAYCDDFGHGKNHAVLPIGARAVLNTNENRLTFCLGPD